MGLSWILCQYVGKRIEVPVRECVGMGAKTTNPTTENRKAVFFSLWFLKFVVLRALGPLTGRDSLVFLSEVPVVQKS